LGGPSWNGWGLDAQNTRYQPVAGLSAADVPRLKLKWAFGFPGVSGSGSQVTVVGDRLFVGSRNGPVYALDRRTGCLVWAFEADAGVRSTPIVVQAAPGSATVYFGDAHAHVYALDAATGAVKWKTQVETHLDAMITGGVAYANGRLLIPVSSLEEASATAPTYPCCTVRGSGQPDATTGRQAQRHDGIRGGHRRMRVAVAGSDEQAIRLDIDGRRGPYGGSGRSKDRRAASRRRCLFRVLRDQVRLPH
jgi:polyvinyl alcohol dehydrogenase (cytochrome)